MKPFTIFSSLFSFLCKESLIICNKKTRYSTTTLSSSFLQNPFLTYFSTSTNQPSSFTLSYLTNSCGLSHDNAISAASKIHLQTSERPDSVITLLANHGFTKTQISHLIYKWPKLLLVNPDKSLMPKIEFFHSLGFSYPELAKILTLDTKIFRTSLKNKLIPTVDFLKTILDNGKDVITIFKRTTWIFSPTIQRCILLNITLLRDHGAPESNILTLLKWYPRSFCIKPARFNEGVKKIVEMGFNPSKFGFVYAVHVISAMEKSTWEVKSKAYRKWGWSEEEILSAFKMHPSCMHVSEKKIAKIMDFLVNKMCWDSSAIARCPTVLTYSLEKRIIPRCSVIQLLLSKGLIKKDLKMSTFLVSDGKYFLRNFLSKYEKEVPELVKIYQGKAGFLALGFGYEKMDGIEKV